MFRWGGFFRVFEKKKIFERKPPAASMRTPCLIYLSSSNEAVFYRKSIFIPGCAQGAITSLVCLSGCVCSTFVVFTDCESCTRSISTTSGSMEAGAYGLTHGTCFVARCLEVVAATALSYMSWWVFGAARFSVSFFSFELTRPAARMRPPCLIYLSTSTGVRTGCHYLFSLSVCVSVSVCMCNIRRLY